MRNLIFIPITVFLILVCFFLIHTWDWCATNHPEKHPIACMIPGGEE